MAGEEDLRRHPRFRVALRVHIALPSGDIAASTTGVSREGLSVRLSPTPALDEELPISIELPSGTSIDGRARTRSILPGCLVGMSLAFGGESRALWEAFIDEEEQTGSLWRMIGRMAKAPDDVDAPRGVQEKTAEGKLRFHTVGENGEAYRICFEKQAWELPDQCDLADKLPGFREQGLRLVAKVLREPVTLRLDDGEQAQRVRIAELLRGGFAYVQGGPGVPTGLVSLCAGELMLVERDGQRVFPFFDDGDLERIACDTFRRDLARPVFAKSNNHTPARGVRVQPKPVPLPPLPPERMPARFKEGIDAVRFAQAASDDVQVRRYGDREIFFHPSVWAKVQDEGGVWMGPTLQDEDRVCILALVGPGAPKVIRLDDKSPVTILRPPRG